MTKKVVAPVSVPMSTDQAGRMADRLVTKCRKDGATLNHAVVQAVLEEEGDALAEEQFNALRARVERRADEIVRPFKVDRTKKPAGLHAAMGRKEWYTNHTVLKAMPNVGPAEGELVIFPLKRDTPIDEVEAAYDLHNAEPDPCAFMQVMADDPALADERFIGCQWDEVGSCVYVLRSGGAREVLVRRIDTIWDGSVWLAGRRKAAEAAE